MAMVKDPVCGMEVDSDTTPFKLQHGDHTHYFCSQACLDKFQANPGAYGDHHAGGGAGAQGDAGAAAVGDEPRWTTEGNVTAPKYGSAGSGGLEYEPLPPGAKD